jgi:hypothetical protein
MVLIRLVPKSICEIQFFGAPGLRYRTLWIIEADFILVVTRTNDYPKLKGCLFHKSRVSPHRGILARGVKTMYLLALLTLLSAMALPTLAESTEEMLSSCRRVAEGKVGNGDVTFQPDFETGMCWGAFAALQKVTNIALAPGKQPALGVCGPKDSTRTQDIAIFIDFVRRNPQRLHEDFVLVAYDALRAAFPCHK